MGSLFAPKAKKPKPDPSVIAAQRRQNEELNKREKDQAMELGARNRLLRAKQSGRGDASLFAQTGPAAGAASTLGG